MFSLHGDLSPVCGLFTDFTGTSRWGPAMQTIIVRGRQRA